MCGSIDLKELYVLTLFKGKQLVNCLTAMTSAFVDHDFNPFEWIQVGNKECIFKS